MYGKSNGTVKAGRMLFLAALLILLPGISFGGDATPPAGPGETSSYTLGDVYDRLDSGTPGAPGAETEPTSAPPEDTGRTVDEIMGKAPAKDDANGATPSDVVEGKTFWGLTGGQWGPRAGSLSAQTVDNTTVLQDGGIYGAFDLSIIDTDLSAGNIKSGVSVYGVDGTVVPASGNAGDADVRSGKTYSSDAGASTGTMPTRTLSDSSSAVEAGYYEGTTLQAVDADLAPGNITAGVGIFGVQGTAMQASGDAAAGEVLEGRTFSNASGAGVGAMPNNGAVSIVPGAAAQAVAAGYHNGSGTVAGDSDLVPGNIKKAVEIFGVTGVYPLSPVPATGAGDDSNPPRGVALPDPRFTNNNNGTVTDNLTGLVWLKKANCEGEKNWDQAHAFANGLRDSETSDPNDDCGLSDGSQAGDWHLPTVRELLSLINYNYSDPALSDTAGADKWTPDDPFRGVESSNYWSSTGNANDTDKAWNANPNNGNANNANKTNTNYAWPVRAGE